jgi:hypothetical protein
MELWREKLEERSSEAFGANVGLEDSSGGTRGQLVGGTVEVQVAENSGWENVPSVPLSSAFFEKLVELSWPPAVLVFFFPHNVGNTFKDSLNFVSKDLFRTSEIRVSMPA